MSRSVVAVVAVLGFLASNAASARAEVTADEVRKAIDLGVAFLLDAQQPDGSWPDAIDLNGRPSGYMTQPGGVSALCTLALLNAGVPPHDEKMKKALRRLRSIDPQWTYTVALHAMVFARAEPKLDRKIIERDVAWLEEAQITTGSLAGAWGYRRNLGYDNSNSQFALLAFNEAERVGVPAGDRTWLLAKRYWEKCQNADGSWPYRRENRGGTGSMTCAGITSLVIAADRTQPADARAVGSRIECCAPRAVGDDDRVESAMQWLGRHYSISHHPGYNGSTWLLYYLYGLERAGRLASRRFIPLPPHPGQPDRADWYREGAELLVQRQDRLSGSWSENPVNPLIGTSFALLFLSKGRWPVLMAKLEHAPAGDWNHHRHDVANLTRCVESRWKRDLTWQVVDMQLATVEDMLQAPVVYLTGSQNPLPKEPDRRKEIAGKLRDYLDRGGFLLADADCRSQPFDAGFRELMQLVFPEPEYRLQLLDPEHPIWHAEEAVDPRQLRPVLGIDFGCRTSVVYVAPEQSQQPRYSLSCLWELSRPGRDVTYDRKVQVQIDAALALGVNILSYATNRELKTKEDFFRRAAPSDPVERGRLDVANLRHPGGCNATPRAIRNLMDAADGELKLRTHVRDKPLDITDDALFDFHLVFMHGRTAFRLTDAERERLRQYIERGGILCADSICSSPSFTNSFRREIETVFGKKRLKTIPAADPLFSTKYGGFDLKTVSRRDPSPAVPGKPPKSAVHDVPPEFEGVDFGDRWGVIFSPYDLSCALERQDSLGCLGHTRDSASRLGLNILLYSLQQ
jgi:hypothetical protein